MPESAETLPAELANVESWAERVRAARKARERGDYVTAQRIWRDLALDAMKAFHFVMGELADG